MDTSKRLEMCHFMQNAGMKLHLPQVGIATAIVYFHRFYASHSKEQYDPFLVATTCLFLAGKVVDTFSKLQDVVEHAVRLYETRPHSMTDKEKFRRDVLRTERVVLKTISFDFNSQLPYTFVITYVKNLGGNQELLQIAWNWVNDSLKTVLCLRYKPEQIAGAAVLLAAKLLKTSHYKHVLEHPEEPFCDEKLEVLEEIYVQILDLYENCPGVTSLKRRGISTTNEDSRSLMLTQSAANSGSGYRSGGASEKIDVPRFSFKTATRPPALPSASQASQPSQPSQPSHLLQPSQPPQSKPQSASLPGISRPPAQKLPPVERKPDPKPNFPTTTTSPQLNGPVSHSNGSNKSPMHSPPASMKVDQNVAPNLLESGEIPIEPLAQQHSMKVIAHERKEVRYSPY